MPFTSDTMSREGKEASYLSIEETVEDSHNKTLERERRREMSSIALFNNALRVTAIPLTHRLRRSVLPGKIPGPAQTPASPSCWRPLVRRQTQCSGSRRGGWVKGWTEPDAWQQHIILLLLIQNQYTTQHCHNLRTTNTQRYTVSTLEKPIHNIALFQS